MIRESAYSLICRNLQGPSDISAWQETVGITFPGQIDYSERGLSEEDALKEEVKSYLNSSYKNATALFCAFQLVHKHYLKNRRINPEDTQQSPS